MRQLLGLLGLLGALVLPTAGAQARPFEFKDHLGLTWISQVATSPDGKLLAVVVSRRSLETNAGSSTLMLLSARSGAPQAPQGFNGQGASQPAFSADGGTLAFVTRAGDKQVFRLLELASGKVRDLPVPGGGASGLRFSSKGLSLVFEGRVYPGCRSADCNDARRAREASSPVLARAFTRLLYRHWDSFDDGQLAHVLELPLDGEPLDDLTPSDDIDITHGWDLSPDGRTLALAMEPGRERAWRLNPEVYVMDPGKPRTLRRLTDNPALDATPAFSPDGRKLGWLSGTKPQYESDQFRVVVRRLRDDQTLLPPTDPQEPVESWGWLEDSKGLWLTFPKEGRNSLAEARLDGGYKVLAEGRTMTQVQQLLAGQYIYVKDSLSAGSELYAFGGRGGEAPDGPQHEAAGGRGAGPGGGLLVGGGRGEEDPRLPAGATGAAQGARALPDGHPWGTPGGHHGRHASALERPAAGGAGLSDAAAQSPGQHGLRAGPQGGGLPGLGRGGL